MIKLFKKYLKYRHYCRKYAERRFIASVLPWLMENKYSFTANPDTGKFTIFAIDEKREIGTTELPYGVFVEVMQDVPGTVIKLGCLMPSYDAFQDKIIHAWESK
jgi:hypothetical protein